MEGCLGCLGCLRWLGYSFSGFNSDFIQERYETYHLGRHARPHATRARLKYK
jgi:hypothetical protein